MKTLKHFFFVSLLLLTVARVEAQSIEIYPVPHNVNWSQNVAFDNSATYTIVGEADADVDAVALFKKKFTLNGNVELVIGERGDAAVKAYENNIPQKAEGYYLDIKGNRVVIAGNDGSGTFYGVQSFIQIASQPKVMEVTIKDYPDVPKRGLVEGFYGNPYSVENRMSLFELFGRQKMNIYIYGPKDDVYHKSKWREEYPADLARQIEEYVDAAKANKVEFVWAIHPGEDIEWNDTDRRNIVNKLKAMCRLGVRTFAVFWDDLWEDDGTHGDEQASLMNYIAKELSSEYPDVNPLIICPTQYHKAGSYGVYLPTLGSTMNSDINVMWTGNSVVDMIDKSDVTWINNQINRKAFIWLNYPVTDYCIDHLLMGPTFGNGTDIANLLSGFVSNPMEYAEASKVSLFSIGDYTWNMGAYDSDASWEAAIKYLMPTRASYFRHFCENNVDLGSNVHGLRRMNESPAFVAAKDIFDRKIADGDSATAYIAVGEEFQRLTASANALLGSDEAVELIEEVTPWIMAMKYLGQMGGKTVEMYFALADNNPEQFIESYLQYAQYEKAHKELRSRDFEGSLRVAKPAVGSVHIEPFVKEKASDLIALYKSEYDYRTDVFPPQTVENGVYHIMYQGKYLTNNNPGASGGAPMFLDGKNEKYISRQEWQISIDPTTKRYRILSNADSRYLNENGTFSANETTNPYEAAWHTYNIYLLANGKYAIQTAGSAGDNLWSVSGVRLQKSGNTTVIPPRFIFDIVPAGGSVNGKLIDENKLYHIVDNGKFLTNTDVNGVGGVPTFQSVAELTPAQEWKIEPDVKGLNCYKITSNADGRFIDETGAFGTADYLPNRNTYLITAQGDRFSIRLTQQAGTTDCWVSDGNRFENKAIDMADSYTITIVEKGTVDTGIGCCGAVDATVLYNKENCSVVCSGFSDDCSISVMDICGNVVGRGRGNAVISMQGESKGLYIVMVEEVSGKKVYKILHY